MKPFIIVKLGGSAITDKSVPYSYRAERVDSFAHQIQQFLKHDQGQHTLVLVHGSGSFGHTEAKKYQVKQGFTTDPTGACITHHAAQSINLRVMESLTTIGLDVASIAPSSIMTAHDGTLEHVSWGSFERCLLNDITPVLYGDVIWDASKGCSIFSGERIMDFIVQFAQERDYGVSKVIHVGAEQGVYDASGTVIPEITPDSVSSIPFGEVDGADVTGGMRHKVMECLAMAKMGIEVSIIDGQSDRSLLDALTGDATQGTRITG